MVAQIINQSTTKSTRLIYRNTHQHVDFTGRKKCKVYFRDLLASDKKKETTFFKEIDINATYISTQHESKNVHVVYAACRLERFIEFFDQNQYLCQLKL